MAGAQAQPQSIGAYAPQEKMMKNKAFNTLPELLIYSLQKYQALLSIQYIKFENLQYDHVTPCLQDFSDFPLP